MGVKHIKENSIFLELIDSLFIMILCFGTLLSAMLIKGNTVDELKYTINFTTFVVTLLGLGICLSFILIQSEKELKIIIKQIYTINSEISNKD